METSEVTSAWLAKHVLGWHIAHDIDDQCGWYIFAPKARAVHRDVWIYPEVRVASDDFDPLHNPVDALRVWAALPNPKRICWYRNTLGQEIINARVKDLPVHEGLREGFAGILCRAAQAWVVAQEALKER